MILFNYEEKLNKLVKLDRSLPCAYTAPKVLSTENKKKFAKHEMKTSKMLPTKRSV